MNMLIVAIATYRITYLLLKEDGPAGLSVKFVVWIYKQQKQHRDTLLGKFFNFLAEVIECFYCTSFWVALGLTALAATLTPLTFFELFFWPLAASGLAMLVYQFVPQYGGLTVEEVEPSPPSQE